MLASRRFRLSALLAGCAVVAASVLPAFPAAAEEPPTPDPVVTSEVVEPTPEATPTADPTPEATPTTEPTSEPTPEATPTAEPSATPTPTASSQATVQYSGTAQQTSDDGFAIDENVVLFGVTGQGYLSVDVSGLSAKPNALNPVLLTLEVPAALSLAADADARFAQLATASAAKPLIAVTAKPVKQTVIKETSALVNQTPNVSSIHHVFAVYVSPSNKKIKDPGQSNNTAATNLVTYADTYWNAQSSGSIRFTLDGVVPWYQSTYSCSSQSGSASLWNQALAKAKSAGYVPGKNMHLALIFPNGSPSYSYCGGPIGLGSVGGSVNQGGQIWVMGNTDQMAKETIAHELGHNMSLGHADWLACSSATPNVGAGNAIYGPNPGIAGCDVRNYGDTVDVMGYGLGDGASGALSSPQAIRAGVWPSSAWTVAPIANNQPYTLLPVAGHTGLRSVMVQDKDGTAFFVELRNFENEDAGNYIGCDSQACTLQNPHVRILRFEPTGYSGFIGEDSYLIGRSNTNIGYTGAGTYTLPSGGTIQVLTVAANQATIQVTRPTNATLETDDFVHLYRTLGYDGSLRVGDTMTLFLGDWWDAETYTFAWLRDGAVISGATGQSYTLGVLDKDHKISARVNISGVGTRNATTSSGAALGLGYGPIVAGVYQTSDPGPVSVDSSATPLVAVTPVGGAGNWPSGTTFSYQWLRGSTATTATTASTGAGAKTASYTPNSADYNQFLRVKVTATVPGYKAAVRYSAPAKNLSINSPSVIIVTGTPKIGTQVQVDTGGLAFFDYAGNSLSGVTLAYQWLRNGVPITDTFTATIDATDDEIYTLRSLDYNASITLRVTASKPGWVSKVITTPAFKPNQLGVIQATSPEAFVANSIDAAAPSGFRLTATNTGVTETELGTPSYQWYRVNLTTAAATAISGATSAVYKPVAADYPYKLRVVVTVKKLGYASLPLPYTRDFSLRLDPATPLGFSGVALQTGNTVTPDTLNWKFESSVGNYSNTNLADPSLTSTFQWKASGVVAGNAWAYPIKAADVGKTLTYTAKASYPGYLAYSATSPKTAVVTAAPFGINTQPTVGGPALTLTVTAAPTDVTPDATKITYQWLRDGKAISKATATTYKLVAADYGHAVTVKVTYTRTGYATHAPIAFSGNTGNYWLRASPTVPALYGNFNVNGAIYVDTVQFFEMLNTGAAVPGATRTYQWLRNGVPIVNAASDDTYVLQDEDKGKSISVRLTASAYPTLLPSISTSAATPPIGTSTLPGWNNAAIEHPAIEVLPESTAFTKVLGIDPLSVNITSPDATPNTVAYLWLRDGVAITGATKSKYTLTQSDRGHLIGVRLTISHKPIGTTTYTNAVLYSTTKDYTLLSGGSASVYIQTTFTVGAELDPENPTFTDADLNSVSAITQSWQWYRTIAKKTVAIPASQGGTNSYYFLKAADLGATMSVKVTTGADDVISHIATYTTAPPTLKVMTGTLYNVSSAPVVTVGVPATNTLLATPPDVTGEPQYPGSLTQHATFSYQWLRNGVAIKSATAATYKLTSSDSGKDISVKVTAKLAGYASVVLPLSTPLNYNINAIVGSEPYASVGAWEPGANAGVYGENFETKDGALASPTVKYQWLRNGAVIAGATDGIYMLQAADVGKMISARLTVSAPGYLPLVFTTGAELGVPGTTTSLPSVTVVPGSGIGALTADFSGLVPANPVPVYSYKWFRSGTAISTASQYKLVAADAGKEISLQVTMTRAGFTQVTTVLPETTGVDYTIYADGAVKPAIAGTVEVGEQLTATPPDFYDDAAYTTITGGTIPVFAWYRSGVLIAGQTAATYTLQAADKGKLITVKVTATKAGRLAATSVASDPTATVVSGNFAGTLAAPAIAGNSATKKVSATLAAFSISTPLPYTKSYVWKRNGVVVSGATASSFTLASGDSSKDVTVTITVKKDGYNSVALVAHANAITSAEPVFVNGDPKVGTQFYGAAPFYYTWGTAQLLPASDDVEWLLDDVPVAGDPGSPQYYTAKPADEGKTLKFRVTVSAPYHLTRVDTSAGVVIGP